MGKELVLVTGGSGFLGVHCIARLLSGGYRVRATVRSHDREADVLAQLDRAGVVPGRSLTFALADLMEDDGWPSAMVGVDYVLHTASPFPAVMPEDENDLIVPAKEGTLRVLRAARKAGVKRVVMTSSFAAVGYGGHFIDRPYTEDDWTHLTDDVSPYVKSKTLAERAAWEFIEREGKGLELAVVNPVVILGPVLGTRLSTSVGVVRQFMATKSAGVPKTHSAVVDVRDVAELHILAMTSPEARGQRFLAVAGESMSLPQMAKVLHARLGDRAPNISTVALADWLVRLAAFSDPVLRDASPELGLVKNVSAAKARTVLGWAPRSNEETLVATAESLIELDLVGGKAA